MLRKENCPGWRTHGEIGPIANHTVTEKGTRETEERIEEVIEISRYGVLHWSKDVWWAIYIYIYSFYPQSRSQIGVRSVNANSQLCLPLSFCPSCVLFSSQCKSLDRVSLSTNRTPLVLSVVPSLVCVDAWLAFCEMDQQPIMLLCYVVLCSVCSVLSRSSTCSSWGWSATR